MLATANPPVTAERLKALMQTSDIARIPASVDEFWSLIELPEYRFNYHQNEIICTMSYASTNHERIVRNFITAFDLTFSDKKGETFGSNRPIYAVEYEDIFECGVHLVMGGLQEHHYGRVKTATLNPSVIVEVFSDSTKSFDILNKLPCYKTMPSVQHIIYVEPNKALVSVYSRGNKPNLWLNEDYNDLNQKIKLYGKPFSLKQLYKNVIFGMGISTNL
jgi:Uma2 family endonuclease